jgi:hypothetical protein
MSPTPLKRSYKIHSLAADLGIRPSADPVREILRYSEKRIRLFLREFPDCLTLSQLLDVCASKLGTRFEEIRSEEQLEEVCARYLRQHERAFATLHDELSENVFGVTFKRLNRKPWELPYVSVIDCRGDKSYRSYYTKWHELGHLLLLTDQMRLSFRRTHFGLDEKDPEESLVDVIAGAFGFFADLIKPHATSAISFGAIEDLRARLCPEASVQSSLIGLSKAWPAPCILLEAQIGLKRGEQRQQRLIGLDGEMEDRAALRAVRVLPNDVARATDFVIYQNMRVPERSIIQVAFRGEPGPTCATENLAWWESSDGQRLADAPVLVQVQRGKDGIRALVTPT